MSYSADIREKIKNIYFQKERIGNKSISPHIFDFLNKYEFEPNQNHQISSLSENSYKNIIFEIENNPFLQNELGIEFLSDLRVRTFRLANFFTHTHLTPIQLTKEVREHIEKKANILSQKFGLHSLSYTLDDNLTPEENLKKANFLFSKVEIELDKLADIFHYTDKTKIGKNILSIEVNWLDKSQDTIAYYNSSNNSIVLKDESNAFPLIHEYVHFLDKTAACILLTGLTTKEAIEAREFTKKQMFDWIDMSIFTKISFFNSSFLDTLHFKSLYGSEISNNKNLAKIFNHYDKKIDYKSHYQAIVFDYIDKNQLPNAQKLKNQIISILNFHSTKNLDLNSSNNTAIFSEKELTIIQTTQLYHGFNKKQNVAMHWAEFMDKLNASTYYTSQKEMLARTVEKIVNKNLNIFSDELTTPILTKIQRQQLLNVLKEWHTVIETKPLKKPQSFLLKKIIGQREAYYNNKKIIKAFKQS